jgi:hypothetical protein
MEEKNDVLSFEWQEMLPPKLRLFLCSGVGLSAASPDRTVLKHVRTMNCLLCGRFAGILRPTVFGGMNFDGCSGEAAVFCCFHATRIPLKMAGFLYCVDEVAALDVSFLRRRLFVALQCF